MKVSKVFAVLVVILVLLPACTGKKSKSELEIDFVQDTLAVGYTYWWPESGPFMGQCGDELSLVLYGTLVDLKSPTEDAGPLYTSQKGTIAIDRVFKIKPLGEGSYANQRYITTDCFDGLHLSVGDQLLVCCFDYEGGYTLPGDKSILKLSGAADPLITSLRKYIDSDQNAMELKKDVGLWATYGLGRKLQDIIRCQEDTDR